MHVGSKRAAKAYLEVFEQVDVVLTPTLSTPPWAIGLLSPRLPRAEAVACTERAVGDTPILTTGRVPGDVGAVGVVTGRLPLGMHVAPAPGADQQLLDFWMAHRLEVAILLTFDEEPSLRRLSRPSGAISCRGSKVSGRQHWPPTCVAGVATWVVRLVAG